MKKRPSAFILSFAVIALCIGKINAQQSAFKAAFLYHFTEYIDWGNARMETFNFAVLDKTPVTSQMRIIANEKKIKNKTIAIKEYSTLDAVEQCHILYVSESCAIPIETILAKFSGKPVLIVTEREGYGKKGAHINFLVSENRLRFEINTKSFSSSGIGVSSQLLQHAVIVE
jgi:hypothetical protein